MNAATFTPDQQRLPALLSLLMFAALCASIAYWALQWLAPPPRAVAAPVASEPGVVPVAAAARLFGGAAKGSGTLNVQLRGIIHAGSAADSAAILSVDGSAPKFYRLNAELMPGVSLKAIHARTIVLSEHGAERELPLPAFAAQESSGAPIRAMSEQSPPQQPAPASTPQLPSQSQPGAPQSPSQPAQASQGVPQAYGNGGLGSDAAGGESQDNARSGGKVRRLR
jgi:general secretion pathway protein C